MERMSISVAVSGASGYAGGEGGRIVCLTSGQDLGPMPGELAYANDNVRLLPCVGADLLAQVGQCIRCCSSSLSCFSFAHCLFFTVFRPILKFPFLVFPQ